MRRRQLYWYLMLLQFAGIEAMNSHCHAYASRRAIFTIQPEFTLEPLSRVLVNSWLLVCLVRMLHIQSFALILRQAMPMNAESHVTHDAIVIGRAPLKRYGSFGICTLACLYGV